MKGISAAVVAVSDEFHAGWSIGDFIKHFVEGLGEILIHLIFGLSVPSCFCSSFVVGSTHVENGRMFLLSIFDWLLKRSFLFFRVLQTVSKKVVELHSLHNARDMRF